MHDMYEAPARTAFEASTEIDQIQVDLIRALAGAHRLQIVHCLRPGPREVGELARELDLPQATISANLAAMRAVGLVEAARDGRVVRYRIADPEILDACDLMRNVIVRRLSALGSLVAAAGGGPASHPDLQVTTP